MADQLGKLRAKLEADSKGFTSGIATCKQSLGGFSSFAGKALGGLQGIVGTLGAAIAGMGFAASIKSSLDELDRIDELSSTFGIATADLQKLSLIATQSGIDLDGLGKATTKLYKTLASDPDVFADLGLSAAKLSAVDLPTKLGMIGDALNNIEGAEQRVAAAMTVFGKSGADLLPLLQNGMEGIAAAAGEVKIFSDEDIAKAVEANDALDKAGKSLKSIITDLAVTFAPAIAAVADAVAKLAEVFEAAQEQSAKLGGGWGAWVGERTSSPLLKALLTGGGNVAGTSGGSYTKSEMAELRRIREASEKTAGTMSAPSW